MASVRTQATSMAAEVNGSPVNEQSKMLAVRKYTHDYAPVAGFIGAQAFGASVMAPKILSRVFGNQAANGQNFLFALSHVGTAIYIHNRLPVGDILPLEKATLISITGGVIFNYGTLLVLANVKHYLPESPVLRCAIGAGVVSYLFWIGREYLNLNKGSSTATS